MIPAMSNRALYRAFLKLQIYGVLDAVREAIEAGEHVGLTAWKRQVEGWLMQESKRNGTF